MEINDIIVSDVGTVFWSKWTHMHRPYLGYLNTKDGDCEKEIMSRLDKRYAITTHLKSIISKSRDSKCNKGKTTKGLSESINMSRR